MLRPFAPVLIALVCAAAADADPITVKVLSCYDGDTCRLEREILPGRDRLRLANAGTPEIEGRCADEIDRAVMARDHTRALVVGKVVTLSAIEPDKYRKRIDAYVSIDGHDDPLSHILSSMYRCGISDLSASGAAVPRLPTSAVLTDCSLPHGLVARGVFCH